MRQIPVLPGPRARALLVLWNPDATLHELSAVIAVDPAMTAQVLRASNSVLSAPIDRIATAHDAVVRLGFTAVKQLVEAAVLQGQFHDLGRLPLDTDEAWRYALASAVITETLLSGPQAPLGFTAGLLHDLGRLTLAAESPSRYEAAIRAMTVGTEQLQAERTQFGTTHAEVGAEIARHWRLPEAVAEAAAHHHHDFPELAVTGAVALARLTVLGAGYEEGLPVRWEAPVPEAGLAALAQVGGAAGLGRRVRWYREALEIG